MAVMNGPPGGLHAAWFLTVSVFLGHPFRISPSPTPKLMSKLPPGLPFILRRLFSWKVVGYSAFVYALHVGTRKASANVPLWMIVSSSIAALPALLLAQCQLEYWMNQRKARSLGARLVPTVPTRWPGGIDLIATIINVFKMGYIGELTTRSRWHAV